MVLMTVYLHFRLFGFWNLFVNWFSEKVTVTLLLLLRFTLKVLELSSHSFTEYYLPLQWNMQTYFKHCQRTLYVCYVEFSNYMICFPFRLSAISSPVLIVFPLLFFSLVIYILTFYSFQLDFDVCKFFLVQTSFCLSFSSRSMFLLFQGLVVPWHSILTSLPAWSIGITTFGRIWIHYTFIIPGPMYMKTVLGFSIQKVLEG